MGLAGLIVSVRGEPDIHSAVGALPHEAAPLLDQMHKKGTPVMDAIKPMEQVWGPVVILEEP